MSTGKRKKPEMNWIFPSFLLFFSFFFFFSQSFCLLHFFCLVGVLVKPQTSLIRRYTDGVFTPNYKLTIGVDFAVKTLNWDANTQVNLQLW